jgi:GrpB-like predicted nucleotidyltransferase (UPF0157 family)
MAIEVADYDERWPAMFEAEATRLYDALGDLALRIDHVGSTAVPGLAAKPVIDIQVSVKSLDPKHAYTVPLATLGYVFTTMPLPYLHRPDDWPHTHHVHVRLSGGHDERRTLAFRDWLRVHPADRHAYEQLKRKLARDADASSAAGRARYSEAKTDFIREIERRSRAGG